MLNMAHGNTWKDHGKGHGFKTQKSVNLVLTVVDSYLMISVTIICFVCIAEQ